MQPFFKVYDILQHLHDSYKDNYLILIWIWNIGSAYFRFFRDSVCFLFLFFFYRLLTFWIFIVHLTFNEFKECVTTQKKNLQICHGFRTYLKNSITQYCRISFWHSCTKVRKYQKSAKQSNLMRIISQTILSFPSCWTTYDDDIRWVEWIIHGPILITIVVSSRLLRQINTAVYKIYRIFIKNEYTVYLIYWVNLYPVSNWVMKKSRIEWACDTDFGM